VSAPTAFPSSVDFHQGFESCVDLQRTFRIPLDITATEGFGIWRPNIRAYIKRLSHAVAERSFNSSRLSVATIFSRPNRPRVLDVGDLTDIVSAMDPTKIRMRYLLWFLLAAVITAALLRHFLHVGGGFSRKQILEGALAAAVAGAIIAAAYSRLARRRR
jgi:hypothetical protein